MNRLAPAHARRVVWIAALSMLATSNVMAENNTPSGSSASSDVSTSTEQTLATGRQSLNLVGQAIARQDFHAAVQSFRSAAAAAKAHPQLASEVETYRLQLQSIGIDAGLLALPPSTATGSVTKMPEVAAATPMGTAKMTPSQAKQQALRLVAIGRAALDRGDLQTALTVARQAEALNVPEKDFQAGEPRVWEFVLDARSAARRSGIALASANEPANTTASPVRPAVGTNAPGTPNFVEQMLFSADADAGETGANGAVAQVQHLEPEPQDTYAGRMFQEGLQALTSGNKVLARQRFLEAWKHEKELTPAQRSQLKDKLTLLQPARLGTGNNASNSENMTPMQQADLESQEKTRRMFREVTAELADNEQLRTSAPLDALDQLERLHRRVDQSDLSDQAKRSLAMMVDRAITQQKKYIEANRAKIDLDLQNEAVRTEMANEQAREQQIDEEVAALVNTFNTLMKERRYQEAEVIAKQVQELKPGDPIAISMFHNSRMGTRLMMDQEIRDEKEDSFVRNLLDVDRSAIPIDPNLPIQMPDAKDWQNLSRIRLESLADSDSRLSARELEIKKKLDTEVNVKFTGRPLGEAMEDLSAMTGVPIVLDERALADVRVASETPVTLPSLEGISLKSALNLMLRNLELTYVIENDVLSVTSMEAKRTKVYPVTYRVTDLVTPIPNFTSGYEDGLAGALRAAYQMSNPQADVQVVPVSVTDLGTGMASHSVASDVLGQYHSMGSQGGFGLNNPPGGGAGGGSFADFQSLIDLIQTTIVPDTWEALGGPSTMAPYPQNLSLVISTTSDVHDQIVDLLESLRRLQNLQITIEVRFITLADSFAEQIGVDFQAQFDDNVQRLPDDDSGPSVVVGFDGINGLPTPDLDITFSNGSFGLSPPFGAAGLGTPSTIGFAILSDIEAFFFLQAAQADNRSNIMQAPKVTLFDGQFATINDQTQRPFVISITPVVGDFAVAQQPVIVVLNEGTQLNVQGIVSDDKRFVRLTLVPFFSQIGAVDTFTFEGRRSTRRNSRNETDTTGDGSVDEVDTEDEEDVTEGTTVQLPTFAFTSVSTTVSVPDGGTILLGGIKRLSEGRTERGLPILSKIPYVSRLFRNVSAGRDARSLMLMVTPRIIIQEEEEVAQTGFDPTRQ